MPPGDTYLTDAKGDKVAIISEEVFEEFDYKTEIAPVRYENALKAHFGLMEWRDDDYGKLLYQHALNSNKRAQELLGHA